MTKVLAIGFALMLAACAGQTPVATTTATLGDACNSMANAIDKVTVVKASLKAGTVAAVDNAIALTQPLCAGVTPAPTDAASAIALVAGEAAAVLAIAAGGN